MNRDMMKLDSISYTGICRELLRYLWVILLAGVAVWLGATGIGKLRYEPVYVSSSTLVVNTKGNINIYSGLSTASQMANVFSRVFQSDALRELIVKDAGEPVKGTISCEQIPETNLLVLKVSSSTPRQAYIFLNCALRNYDEVSEYVFANASLDVVQEPSIPEEPSNTSWLISRRNQLALLGALGISAIVLFFYFWRYTVKTPKAAEGMLDGKIQGVIPYENKTIGFIHRKKKESILVNSPVVSMGYAEACRKLEAGVEHHMRKARQKVLFVGSVGENEGKSTIAANLALSLAERRKKVLLVDGDFRKPAQHKIFEKGEKESISLSDVLKGEKNLESAIVYDKTSGVYQLFQYHASERISTILDSEKIRNLLNDCKKEMDYIIIDCSPIAVATDAEIWIQEVDTVLLVVRQDWSDARIINDTVDLVWQSNVDFAGFALNAFREEGFFESRYGYNYKTYREYKNTAEAERR